jgi:hypothetical protein
MDVTEPGPEESRTVPDVSEMTMIELLHSRDPALVASLTRLTELLARRPGTSVGWASAIDP